jgi:hypothetical protein
MDTKELDEKLAPVLQRIYVAIRQQTEGMLELTHALQAMREVLQQRDSGFAAAYQKKFEELQRGALGQSKAQSLAALDQVIGAMKNWKS